jgi:hypothetical protein
LQQNAERCDTKGACAANLSYFYNHHEREPAERLTSIQHAPHDLTVSMMHAHLDAEEMIAERSVRHGMLKFGRRRTRRRSQPRWCDALGIESRTIEFQIAAHAGERAAQMKRLKEVGLRPSGDRNAGLSAAVSKDQMSFLIEELRSLEQAVHLCLKEQ